MSEEIAQSRPSTDVPLRLNIHLLVYVRLLDETWKGGVRRRFVSEIRQVTRATENGRPVTHLTYTATGTPGQAAGFYPDGFARELEPFRRPLPATAPAGSPTPSRTPRRRTSS